MIDLYHSLPPLRYVEAVVDYLLNKSISKQFSAFSDGFRILCDGPATRLFNAQVGLAAEIASYPAFDIFEAHPC